MSESRPETFRAWVWRVYQEFWDRPKQVATVDVVREEIAAILGSDPKEGIEPRAKRLLGGDVELTMQHDVGAELKRWLDDPLLDPPRRGTPRDV